MEEHKKRKLAAILFADIQGYSALMERDEKRASQLLAKFKNELTRTVKAESGRIVNFYGDGCLAVFESPLRAIRCAEKAQNSFLQQPQVPVRIGLHSGVVVLEDDNVYGDSVNQASRVESMGLAGSVLMSESIRKHLKNQPEYKTTLLGSYEFKNIEEPVKVYALDKEGFTIPDPKYIRGKLKEPGKVKPARVKWPWLLIAALMVVAFLFYRSGKIEELIQLSATKASEHILDDEMRAKRVAVMLFENQTLDKDLDAFGKMISDWITRGLIESGEANVISAVNIQDQIAKAGFERGGNRQLASSTGIDVMLQGRYYLQENQLIIHANIIEVQTGKVIHALEPIRGPRSEMMNLLDQLTEEVLGFWAVKDAKRFQRNPPNFQAYKLYDESFQTFASNFTESSQKLNKAWALDSTFYAPLLRLIVLYGNNGFEAEADSLATFMKSREDYLTKWERNRLQSIIHSRNGEWIEMARLNKERYLMDPSDLNANYNAGLAYSRANYPAKAIEIWKQFDDRYRSLNSELAWRESVMGFCYNRLGRYEEALKVTRSYPFPKMYIGTAAMELRALRNLGRFEEFSKRLDELIQSKIYNGRGDPMPIEDILDFACNEMELSGQVDYLTIYANRLTEHLEKEHKTTKQADTLLWSSALYYSQRYDEAVAMLKDFRSERNPATKIGMMSLLGICYAKQDKTKMSEDILNEIFDIDVPEISLGWKQYSIAKVLANGGKKEQAVDFLAQALENGLDIQNGFDSDALLKPLQGYPLFEELIKPKG